MAPFVWLSEKITRMITKGEASIALTREEFAAMVDIGGKQGQLEQRETRMFRNMMKLDKLRVSDVMTPRQVMFAVPDSTPISDFVETHAQQPFSRIPLYGKAPDDVTGFVIKSEVLTRFAKGERDIPLSEIQRTLPTVLDALTLSALFEVLIENRDHIALVADEYGEVEGLVTLEDVVETVLGLEIVDEHDTVEDMRTLARKNWRERAAALGIDPSGLLDGEKNRKI